MPHRYVALDLETTGLDSERDAIIEVGAIRFDLDGGCETFQTFVNPKRTIPYRIERLTSISNDDVANAPQFAEVAADLEAFIANNPVVGQNIRFDLDFLERVLVRPPGPAYDTQELANLLLPDLREQSLGAIARHLGVALPSPHRALADAETARAVFLLLRERLAALPTSLLIEAERIAAATDWPLQSLLRELVNAPLVAAQAEAPGLMHGAVQPPEDYGRPLSSSPDDPQPVDPAQIEHLLTRSAADLIDGFEERPEQVAMAHGVSSALNHSEQLLVEAGTGVGKSLAYLLPSATYARENDTRVVISTNTLNLQEQLVGQDIPIVQRLLANGESPGGALRAAQLKGRRNYLCLLRLANLRRSTTLSQDEAKLLVRLLLWLPHTDSGDRAELRLSPAEEVIWSRLSAQNEGCLSEPCSFVKDGSCFLLRARKRAEAAHLLVVNHALLLSDVVVGGGVIPEYQHLIVDEAQHLEDEATDQFGFHAEEADVVALLDRVAGRTGGLVASLRNGARGPVAQLATTRDLLELGARVEEDAGRARDRLPDFFLRLAGFVRQQASGQGDYDDRLLLTHAMRVQPDWPEVEMAWESLSSALAALRTALQRLHESLQLPGAEAILEYESLLSETVDLIQQCQTIGESIGGIILRDDPNTVCWITQQRSGEGVNLSSAPLRVSELLEERLFSQKETVVLTSATLTTENSFDYLRRTLGLPDANELLLGSPFDYARSTMVLVPEDMPDPNQSGYMSALQEALIDLIRASRGRALVLFTSHASLRAVHRAIKPALEQEQILVLGHHIDGSPRHLVQALRDQPNTAVLGTASFWEGVDVVGEALSLLVVTRLPFSVPSDPLFEARSELFDDPFNEYAVPQAALRFKQGFGRLIRRKTDRGVMVVLDGRIHSKSYGAIFLGSLPSCAVQKLPLREMPGQVAQWLNNGGQRADVAQGGG